MLSARGIQWNWAGISIEELHPNDLSGMEMNNQDFVTEAARLLSELTDGHAIISQCEKRRILGEVLGVLDYPYERITQISETRFEHPGKKMPWQSLMAFHDLIINGHKNFDRSLTFAAQTLVHELSQLYWGSKGRENRILANLQNTLKVAAQDSVHNELLIADEKH